MKDKQKKTIYIIIAVVFIVLAIIILFLLNGSEKRTSTKKENDSITALDCKAGRMENAFFISSTANNTSHEVKVTFRNDKIDKLYYLFEGVYRTYDIADQDNANFHAKYNIHMSGNGLEQESLAPTFLTAKTKLRINLYAKNREMMNKATAVLFFIKEDDLEKFLDYSRDEATEYYKKQGFSCEKQN